MTPVPCFAADILTKGVNASLVARSIVGDVFMALPSVFLHRPGPVLLHVPQFAPCEGEADIRGWPRRECKHRGVKSVFPKDSICCPVCVNAPVVKCEEYGP